MQAHSCKPSGGNAGGGTDEEFVPSSGLIIGRAVAAGRCLEAQFSIAGARLDAPPCDAANALQQFDWNAAAGTLTLKGTGLCLAVSSTLRQANSFWARDLTVESCCCSIATKLLKWRIVETPTPTTPEADPGSPGGCGGGGGGDYLTFAIVGAVVGVLVIALISVCYRRNKQAEAPAVKSSDAHIAGA